jgi:hypothetical protein
MIHAPRMHARVALQWEGPCVQKPGMCRGVATHG